MKIFANCLELVQIDFASGHVALDSLREMWAADNMSSQNNVRPLYICETMGGFTIRGANADPIEFHSFSSAALLGQSDPLEIQLHDIFEIPLHFRKYLRENSRTQSTLIFDLFGNPSS